MQQTPCDSIHTAPNAGIPRVYVLSTAVPHRTLELFEGLLRDRQFFACALPSDGIVQVVWKCFIFYYFPTQLRYSVSSRANLFCTFFVQKQLEFDANPLDSLQCAIGDLLPGGRIIKRRYLNCFMGHEVTDFSEEQLCPPRGQSGRLESPQQLSTQLTDHV